MEITQAVQFFKEVKEKTPCSLPLVLYLERDGEFIANITAPFQLPDSRLATAMMMSTLAAFNADKAIFACEVNSQLLTAEVGLSPDEDPSATPAVLVIQGERTGESNWVLSPYGVGDHGELAWTEGTDRKSTLTDPIVKLIQAAWEMGDHKAEAKEIIALLHANEYQMVVHRSILEV